MMRTTSYGTRFGDHVITRTIKPQSRAQPHLRSGCVLAESPEHLLPVLVDVFFGRTSPVASKQTMSRLLGLRWWLGRALHYVLDHTIICGNRDVIFREFRHDPINDLVDVLERLRFGRALSDCTKLTQKRDNTRGIHSHRA